MQQGLFEFNKQYNQIVRGLNRIRYIKNKQNSTQSKINGHLLQAMTNLTNPHNNLRQHQQGITNNANINSVNLSPKQHHQSNNKNRPLLGLQQTNSLNMMQIYTSRQNLNKIKQVNNKFVTTCDKDFYQSKNISSLKATDISQDCGPLQQDTSYNEVLPLPSPQPNAQKIKTQQLMAQKSMNYLSMKQNQRHREKQLIAKVKQDRTRNLQKKYRIHQEKIQGRKKIEDRYYEKLDNIYQQKSHSKSKKIRANKKQIEEVCRLQRQQVQHIHQFEQALLLGDHLRIAILQHQKSEIQTNTQDENYKQKRTLQPLSKVIDVRL